jgi:hypothetical protein
MKFCKDCAHYATTNVNAHISDRCLHPTGLHDVVTGREIVAGDPRDYRNHGACGLNAIFFKPKDVCPSTEQKPKD